MLPFWNKKAEFMPRNELEKLQLSRLKDTFIQAKKAPFYRDLINSTMMDKIRSCEDIQDIPFTSKQDLRDHFPYGFLATPLKSVVRLHSSSGTTGNPTVVFHTPNDIDAWSELMARCMVMTGATPTDVFQNTMGYGLFTGGLGFHYGAEKLGMLTIPFGPGNSKRQLWFMQQFESTILHILPSYALHLSSVIKDEGVDPNLDLHLKIAYIGAEPHTHELRQQIEERFGVKAYNSYGLSEMCGPGVAFECPFQEHMHLWEDHYLMEIIHPETGQVLPVGERGELVLTTLQRQAMPLIRYRTRDLTHIIEEPCACGRTHRRIARIEGRSDDMLIINGVNTFPMQIEKVLLGQKGIGKNYRIELQKKGYMDKIIIQAEVDDKEFHGTLQELDSLKKAIREALKSELGLNPEIHLVEPDAIEVKPGKVQRIFDLR